MHLGILAGLTASDPNRGRNQVYLHQSEYFIAKSVAPEHFALPPLQRNALPAAEPFGLFAMSEELSDRSGDTRSARVRGSNSSPARRPPQGRDASGARRGAQFRGIGALLL